MRRSALKFSNASSSQSGAAPAKSLTINEYANRLKKFTNAHDVQAYAQREYDEASVGLYDAQRALVASLRERAQDEALEHARQAVHASDARVRMVKRAWKDGLMYERAGEMLFKVGVPEEGVRSQKGLQMCLDAIVGEKGLQYSQLLEAHKVVFHAATEHFAMLNQPYAEAQTRVLAAESRLSQALNEFMCEVQADLDAALAACQAEKDKVQTHALLTLIELGGEVNKAEQACANALEVFHAHPTGEAIEAYECSQPSQEASRNAALAEYCGRNSQLHNIRLELDEAVNSFNARSPHNDEISAWHERVQVARSSLLRTLNEIERDVQADLDAALAVYQAAKDEMQTHALLTLIELGGEVNKAERAWSTQEVLNAHPPVAWHSLRPGETNEESEHSQPSQEASGNAASAEYYGRDSQFHNIRLALDEAVNSFNARSPHNDEISAWHERAQAARSRLMQVHEKREDILSRSDVYTSVQMADDDLDDSPMLDDASDVYGPADSDEAFDMHAAHDAPAPYVEDVQSADLWDWDVRGNGDGSPFTLLSATDL